MTHADFPQSGIANLLGIGESSELLRDATRRWSTWAEQYPVLAEATDAASFFELRVGSQLDAPDTQAGLHALATLGAVDGGNDTAAAAALALQLIPGMITLAQQLQRGIGSQYVDQVIASQLWLEIRSFPWHRLEKVSGNIYMNVRHHVLAELEVRSHIERDDITWARTTPTDTPERMRPEREALPADEDPSEEVTRILSWACKNGTLSTYDRDLMLSLVEAADREPPTRTGRSGGLLSNRASRQIARTFGTSEQTVRRRVRNSIDALSAACSRGQIPA